MNKRLKQATWKQLKPNAGLDGYSHELSEEVKLFSQDADNNLKQASSEVSSPEKPSLLKLKSMLGSVSKPENTEEKEEVISSSSD